MSQTSKIISAVLIAACVCVAPLGAESSEISGAINIIEIDSPASILPGTTRPVHEVTVGAALDGRLANLLVREGAAVREGDVLAILDDRVAIASLEMAREEAKNIARVDRARVQHARNIRVLNRTQDAHKRGGVNNEELAEAKTNAALSKADLAEAQEQQRAAVLSVKQAEERLEQYSVRAPFDGVVLNIFAERGAVLRTSDPIAALASIRKMRADLYLPAEIALSIIPGDAYALELDEPISRVLWARAVYIEPRIEPTSNTMRVVFNFETPDELIPAGLLVRPADRLPSDAEMAFARGEMPSNSLATAEEQD